MAAVEHKSDFNSQKTPHSSLSRASYEVSIVTIWGKLTALWSYPSVPLELIVTGTKSQEMLDASRLLRFSLGDCWWPDSDSRRLLSTVRTSRYGKLPLEVPVPFSFSSIANRGGIIKVFEFVAEKSETKYLSSSNGTRSILSTMSMRYLNSL